jgi:pimeloyl-ACP methyl ester carboxylesterase
MSQTHCWRQIAKAIGMTLAVLAAVGISIGTYLAFHIEGHPEGSVQRTTVSKDGTIIAYEQSGSGPVVVLVSAALADHAGATRLANELAGHFTVINYDRRGRGKSTDTQPYAVAREVEDIEALIDSSGGKVFLFGSSSGSVLALDAANRFGGKVKKLFMYEPPFIIDNSRPPMPSNFSQEITALITSGRRNDAVKLFFSKGMGIPNFAVTLMRMLMPGWSKMAGLAHTIPYDLAILDGTQSGYPLPAKRWAATTAPTLVVVGSRSEAFLHSGAKDLVKVLPRGRYASLGGGNHGALLMAPKILADAVRQFFNTAGDYGHLATRPK